MKQLSPLIIYHGSCLDGFGGAYAAWRYFGDAAEYRAAAHEEGPPKDVAGRDVYCIDFSYDLEQLQELHRYANRLVVLDHHVSRKDAVESMPEGIYDVTRSGAVIAWEYFHPELAVPQLFTYIQDGDTGRLAYADTENVTTFMSTQAMTFTNWDQLVRDFEQPALREEMVATGRRYREYTRHLIEHIQQEATLVSFESYTVLAVTAPALVRSQVGARLAETQPPFSIVWRQKGDLITVSLRGDGSIDVSALAGRYGGGGHHNAASFRLAWDQPLPFSPASDSAA